MTKPQPYVLVHGKCLNQNNINTTAIYNDESIQIGTIQHSWVDDQGNVHVVAKVYTDLSDMSQ